METFSTLLVLCAGNSPVTVEFQWRGALTFSLICVWINGWVNNRYAGDLRRHRAHYDVTVMISFIRINNLCTESFCRIIRRYLYLLSFLGIEIMQGQRNQGSVFLQTPTNGTCMFNTILNSLGPGRWRCNLQFVIFKLIYKDRYFEHFLWNMQI